MKTAPGNASQDVDGPDGRSKLNRTKTIGVGLAELMQPLSRIEIDTGGGDVDVAEFNKLAYSI